MAGWERVYGMRRSVKGLSRRRGRADVKYQCQGLVPQADAPRLPRLGKILDRKAESSGQSGIVDCQKKVSMGIVKRRPIVAPKRPAGIIM